MSAKVHIKVEIPEVFTALNVFLLQDFEKIFFNHERPVSVRLEALAQLVRRLENR